MRSQRFNDLFRKLAAEEERFLESEFLAPVVRGGAVRVRMAGVVCTLRVTPADFEGWGVFRPTSHSSAELAREPGLAERRHYLELFPLVRLILCFRERGLWMAAPAHQGDQRFRIEGVVPVRFAAEMQQFEVIRSRFDGANFWFESIDPAYDPAAAAYLRQMVQESCDPNQVDRPGLTPEQKAAYGAHCLRQEAYRRKALEKSQPPEPNDRAGQTLRDALRHAGAELVDYLERQDSYRVTFTIGGRRHVSAVRKEDLAVQVAGICLSGQDRKFDLTSLVGVIREAEGTGEIVPVGQDNEGMQEQTYWRVHPPRSR